MRDPARIDRMLDLLRDYWFRYPDMRLAQLVVGLVRPSEPCPQVFYAEDDRVEAALLAALGDVPAVSGGG
ncbi:hypothetical protein [Urbifossiella limnaea]|uniref:DUF1040 family protein n=1 Tax=Urbifossiella limnaea TaxID=2528023 RepID=A0A517Y0V1_9BACT|nr:hypothetical protein [Urbifossiella limnaea]QDU23389.1 hypothetical protein ETAA1_53890 [Urbifossiella limnaea]